MKERSKLILAKQQFGRGEITAKQLRAAANDYRNFLIAYKKRTKKRLNIPSIAHLIRAI